MTVTQLPYWPEAAIAGLARALPDCLDLIRQQVEAGAAQLWHVEGCGYVVTRVEFTGEALELVLVGGEGRGFHQVVPYFQRLALGNGCASVRAHVERAGLVRMYRRHGFVPAETVMRWRHGQQLQ